MTQIHKPSRLQAILFFVFSLLVAAGVFVWAIFLNKGTLIATGAAPFTLKAGTASYDCPTSPCTIQLTPKIYRLTVQKPGYFDSAPEIKIKRWNETVVAIDFQFIPALKIGGDVNLPYPFAPLRPPFLGQKRLENFPKNVKDALFSPSAKKAIITLGKEIYIYDTTDHTVAETTIGPDMAPAWLGEEIAFLKISDDREGLMSWNAGKPAALVSFQKPFESARLLGSPSGKKMLIENIVEDVASYYLVDIEKKSRDKLMLPPQTKDAKWAGDYLVFKTEITAGESESKKRIFALNPDTLQEIDLPAIDVENVIATRTADVFIMITSAKQEASSNVGPSIFEVIEESKKENFEGTLAVGTLYLTEFNVAARNGKTLLEIPMEPDDVIHRLTAGEDFKNLYFTMAKKDGEKLYEVALEK